MDIPVDMRVRSDAWLLRALLFSWGVCVAAPWLSPWSSGPSASVGQWLVTGWSAAGMLVLAVWGGSRITWLQIEKTTIAALLLAAMLNCAVALCQYFGWAEHFAALMSASATHEPYGNLRQRNQFASLTVIGMAALLWFTARGLSLGPSLAAMAFVAVGNAAAASRAGALEMLVLLALVAWWPGPRRAQLIVVLGVGLAVYLVAGPLLPWLADMAPGKLAYGVLGRLKQDESCFSRIVLWSNVVQLIAEKPWAGWGWGLLDYAHYAALYPGERFCDVLDNAHNLPLHLAVELGIPVAGAVSFVIIWFIARRAPWHEADPTRRSAWMVLTVIGIHSAVEYPLWYGPFQLTAWLCVACLWPRVSRPEIAGMVPRGTNSRVVLLGLAAALAAGLTFAGWQYQRASQIYRPADQRLPAYRDDTLAKMNGAWLFRDQVKFAELTLTPLTAANARWTFDTATALLRFSPEPRVIEKVIESALLLGLDDEVAIHMRRYKAAFPKDYAKWLKLRS